MEMNRVTVLAPEGCGPALGSAVGAHTCARSHGVGGSGNERNQPFGNQVVNR